MPALLRPWLHAALAWLAPLLAAGLILAVAWLLWPALKQEQRPAPAPVEVLERVGQAGY